ncbi:tigger transposable element-derived protein 1-like [Palaemon carinicauda]|uniref:tigger transposable element-derived protein 1-like n=1 Tax=Palaemon carinicauda TaxID=392227 RepID=UPI0035B62918
MTWLKHNERIQSIKHVFDFIHGLSHPSHCSTAQLLKTKFIWQGIIDGAKDWVRASTSCQTSKVHRHKDSGRSFRVRHADATGSDMKAAKVFVKKFDELMLQEGYSLQQVCHGDKNCLFGKKWLIKRTLRQKKKRLLRHKPMKDCLTPALCANASGDIRVKPLLVYHSDTPRAFKAHNVIKENLQVSWRDNAKAWVTRHLFTEWVNVCFGPTVKMYLEEKSIPLKCLLVSDNAPAHAPPKEENILAKYSFIKVLLLPHNSTPFFQPMGQQVISNFKKLYTIYFFKRYFQITESKNLTLRQYGRSI